MNALNPGVLNVFRREWLNMPCQLTENLGDTQAEPDADSRYRHAVTFLFDEPLPQLWIVKQDGVVTSSWLHESAPCAPV